jgi:hypothetical protein
MITSLGQFSLSFIGIGVCDEKGKQYPLYYVGGEGEDPYFICYADIAYCLAPNDHLNGLLALALQQF